jgi:hypothetical protein
MSTVPTVVAVHNGLQVLPVQLRFPSASNAYRLWSVEPT